MCVRSGCAVRAAIQDEQAARSWMPRRPISPLSDTPMPLPPTDRRPTDDGIDWLAQQMEKDRGWSVVGDGMPLNLWLETYRAGERANSHTMCLLRCLGDELEWVDHWGRTTVTHSTFMPPTHWRWP